MAEVKLFKLYLFSNWTLNGPCSFRAAEIALKIGDLHCSSHLSFLRLLCTLPLQSLRFHV